MTIFIILTIIIPLGTIIKKKYDVKIYVEGDGTRYLYFDWNKQRKRITLW